MANRIADTIAVLSPQAATADDQVTDAKHLLHAIAAPPTPPAAPAFPIRPTTPLSTGALLVNGRHQPRIGHEVTHEMASADQVDLLCAFIKWHGLRLIEPAIRDLMDRGGRLRVITTTYLGATDQRALDRLAELGADIKVSYETRTTRLHAKAWLFRRNNGTTTAYVGSSNLSRTALVDGVEWNVRISNMEQPYVIDTFTATFEDYWHDPAFEDYDPGRDADRLRTALRGERRDGEAPTEIANLDVRPYPYQAEILADLDAERKVHGRWRNLVVMATGTGKTIVAALDYRRLHREKAVDSLLFVAHQEQILRQSLATFRQVMGDGSFGETLVGGRAPQHWRHVFASIQSLHRREIDPEAYDMVIVDEFHHAEAPTYARLLERLRPRVLLGLTATPDRSDGGDVRRWFDGRAAVELHLWEALERQLLAPFQYFGLHDDVDLSQLRWKRGQGYDPTELDGVYTGNDARARMVLRAVRDTVDVGRMRALGFCVSIGHAEFMADWFTKHGVPSAAVTSRTVNRQAPLKEFKDGTLRVLFTVDLFNEGVDLPMVDTILMLRPTESATIFLQQLGRGLRLDDDKPCLTVLDFIGGQHANFRFDLRWRALTGVSRRAINRCRTRRLPLPAQRLPHSARPGGQGNRAGQPALGGANLEDRPDEGVAPARGREPGRVPARGRRGDRRRLPVGERRRVDRAAAARRPGDDATRAGRPRAGPGHRADAAPGRPRPARPADPGGSGRSAGGRPTLGHAALRPLGAERAAHRARSPAGATARRAGPLRGAAAGHRGAARPHPPGHAARRRAAAAGARPVQPQRGLRRLRHAQPGLAA